MKNNLPILLYTSTLVLLSACVGAPRAFADMTSGAANSDFRVCTSKEVVGYWVMVDQVISMSYEKAHPDLHNEAIFFENQFIVFHKDGFIQDLARRGYTDDARREERENIKDVHKNIEAMKRYPKELTYTISPDGMLIRKKGDEIVTRDLCNTVLREHIHPSGSTVYPGDMVIGVLALASEHGGLKVVAEQVFKRAK